MRHLTVAPLLLVTLTLTGISPAAAQDHCLPVPPGQVRVNLPGGSDASLDVAADGQLVLHIGETDDPCGADNDSTESISVQVTGQDADETFVVDHKGPGGPLRQQVSVNLGQGSNTVGVSGTEGGDTITAGSEAIPGSDEARQFMEMQMYDAELQRQEASELDVDTPGDLIIILFFGGLDIFGTAGINSANSPVSESSALAPLTSRVFMDGGSGNDRLTGGVNADGLVGGKGNDRLVGGKGKDTLIGGKGEDTCKGGPGKDKEKGCE